MSMESDPYKLYKLVYASDGSHAKPEAVNPKATTLKVRLETNGRAGKAVTVVFELPANEEFCTRELSQIKKLCGTGGTYKNGRIEIQGDHRDKVVAYFEKQGFKVKRAGG